MIKFSGSRLSAIRRKHGLSVAEVAEKLGVSRTAVSFWESEETDMKAKHLHMLATLFKKEMGFFFTKDGK